MKKYFAFLAVAALLFATGCGKDNNDDNKPKEIKVTGVTVSETTLSLEVGKTATLTATVAPENATNKKVTWSTDTPTVATVSAAGVVTAVAEGTAKITVTTEDGNKTASTTVTVFEYVTIEGEGFDISKDVNIAASAATEAQVGLTASVYDAEGIQNFIVNISTTSPAFGGLLGTMHLEQFDLANQGALAPVLGMAGLPAEADVKGAKTLSLDLSGFVPMMLGVALPGDFTTTFEIIVNDDSEHHASAALVINVDDDVTPGVTIAGESFDIDEEQTITSAEQGTPLVILIDANTTIENFLVEITSSSAVFTQMLGLMNLDTEFDLANPTPQQAGALGELDGMLPFGDDVKGKREMEFDLTQFVPMMFAVEDADITASFKITVTDKGGATATKTLSLDLVNVAEAE